VSQVEDANRFLCLCDRGEQLRGRGTKSKTIRNEEFYSSGEQIDSGQQHEPVSIHCLLQIRTHCPDKDFLDILLHAVWWCNGEIQLTTVIVFSPRIWFGPSHHLLLIPLISLPTHDRHLPISFRGFKSSRFDFQVDSRDEFRSSSLPSSTHKYLQLSYDQKVPFKFSDIASQAPSDKIIHVYPKTAKIG
jgi:hypothetical protein